MVISTNPNPKKSEFQSLIDNTIQTLKIESEDNQELFLNLLGTKLEDVVVTHSPRYRINMNLPVGETIFDKLDIPYNDLRKLPNPIKPITDYYRQFLKPGDDVWWLDQDDSKSTELIIRSWNSLDISIKHQYRLKAMLFFPEIFSSNPNKYNRLSVWLVNSESIVCPNIRDIFTAGGQGTITWKGKQYKGVPQIIKKLSESISDVVKLLNETDIELLEQYWDIPIKNKTSDWISLVNKNFTKPNSFDLAEYLTDIIAND